MLELGDLKLTPRATCDAFQVASLVQAIREADHPAVTDLYVAALFLRFEGPTDWPTIPEGLISWRLWGHQQLGYLALHDVQPGEAVEAGFLAAQHLPRAAPRADRVEKIRGFFAKMAGSSPASG